MTPAAFIARRVEQIGDQVRQSVEASHGKRMLTLAEVARLLRYKADTSFRKQRKRLETEEGLPLPITRGRALLWDAQQLEAWLDIKARRAVAQGGEA